MNQPPSPDPPAFPTLPVSVTNSSIGGVNVSGGETGNITYTDNRGATIVQTPRQVCPRPLPPPDKFAGRDEELALLKDKLKAGEMVALTAVNGLGGIGKTALARKLAHDLYYEIGAQRYFRAVLWLNVTRLPEEERLLRELVSQVEPEFQANEGENLYQLRQRVRASLQIAIESECAKCEPNRVLFVLDDVWENGVELVNQLKELRPANTTVLITTRFGSVAQHFYTQPITLNRFKPDEGVKMLAAYLPDVSEANLHILSVVLGGHALALRLAVYRLPRLHRTKALQAQIELYRTKLADGTNFSDLELADKETDLEKVLSYTYSELDAVQQARFRALGVLVTDQPFDNQLLAAIWGITDVEVEAEVETLYEMALLDSSVEEESKDSQGSDWYRQHPLLRAYALALLKSDPVEYNTITARYHDRSIEIAKLFLELQNKPEEWKLLDPYLPHIYNTGDTLVVRYQSQPKDQAIVQRALDFAYNIYSYLFTREDVHKHEWLEMGLKAAQILHKQDQESLFLNELGLYYTHRGNQVQALHYYEQSLAMYKTLGNQGGEANALTNIGAVYSSLGDKGKALTFFEQSLPLRQAVGDQHGETITLNNIGTVYSDLGDKGKALTFFEQSLLLRQTTKDQRGEAVTLNNIGGVYSDLGDKDSALTYFKQALSLRRVIGDQRGEAVTLNNIGGVYSDLGEGKKALEFLEQVLQIDKKIGDLSGEATTLDNIGKVYLDSGDKDKALTFFEQALPLCRIVGNQSVEANTLHNIGGVYSNSGEWDKALTYYTQALPLFRTLGDRDAEGYTLHNMGWALWEMGKREDGLQLVEQAQALFEAVRSPNAQIVAAYVAQMREALGQGERQRY